MERATHISASVSTSTKALLDRHVRATGVRRARLIEAALLHHLHALEQLPEDVIIPPRLVLTRASGEAVLASLSKARPTAALRKLMRRGD